jgi:pyrophosphate--fructose-6-phosphate 1-phosphotransferase
VDYPVPLPRILQDSNSLISFTIGSTQQLSDDLVKFFPHTANKPTIGFKPGVNSSSGPLRIAALFSGGQAPGGHNVISGLFDYLKKQHPDSQLIGFLGGPSGLINNKAIEITEALISPYRNQGGFDLLGSGRTKIETPEQFAAAEKSVNDLALDGLIIIGGDDSNTNAALLAEYFISRDVHTRIIGVPKTIDGDLKNREIECSFGFDTASKTYSELIANIQRDAISAKKYCHFIKLMGRTASHITLECALRTHPNAALIGEEIAEKQSSLQDIVQNLTEIISKRAAAGKEYGVFLIPEGLLEFIPECKVLIKELNNLLANDKSIDQFDAPEIKITYLQEKLSIDSLTCFQLLPQEIKLQLLQDRDPHGNIQVSHIESERLIISMLNMELNKRKANGSFKGSFRPLPHFYGYEGRSCYPSNFDSQYCYALGQLAGVLIQAGATGYLACIKKLTSPTAEWEICGVPLSSMMAIEERGGKAKPVLSKALVDLAGAPFKAFLKNREQWAVDDNYVYPGPIQYFGPQELTDAMTLTLQLESEARKNSASQQLTPSPRD